MKRFISAIVMAAAATAAVASYLKKLGDQEEPGVEVIDPQQPAEKIVQVETVEEKELVDKVAEEMAQESAEQTVAPVVDALQEAVEQAKQDLSELGEELVNAVEGELITDEEPAEEQPLEINTDELFGQPDEPVLESIVPEEVAEEVPEEITEVFQQPEEEMVAPVEKIIEEAVEELVEEPVEAVEEAAEEAAPVVDALQDAVEQAGKDLDQLGEDLINAADAEIPAEEPVEVTEPVIEPVVEEPVAEEEIPVEEPAAEPAEEPVSEPVEEAAAEPVEEIREESVGEPEPQAEPVAEKVVLSPEEMLASLSQQYPDISVNKIATIIKTINRMRETITSEKVDIEHFIAFGSEEDRDTLANVFAGEGLDVRKNADDLTLSIFNTMDNNEADLLKTILTLANDAVRYHGTYKGWAIK